MRCLYWSPAPLRDGGHCSQKNHTVSFAVCRYCPANTDPCEWPVHRPARTVRQGPAGAPPCPCRSKPNSPTPPGPSASPVL